MEDLEEVLIWPRKKLHSKNLSKSVRGYLLYL